LGTISRLRRHSASYPAISFEVSSRPGIRRRDRLPAPLSSGLPDR
jgi:hypothetical protein